MISRTHQMDVMGTPKEFPSYDKFCDDIEGMIRDVLPEWHSRASQRYQVATEGEPILAADLCGFLNQKSRACSAPWQFNHEHPRKRSRAEDMTAGPHEPEGTVIENRFFPGNERFYTIEAKRLPTPNGKKKEDRTREYVCGQWNDSTKPSKPIKGGIERFKEGKHGDGLNRGGMVAFIQSQTPQHWLGEVNRWIGDLHGAPCPCPALKNEWVIQDALVSVPANSSAVHTEYVSFHGRGAGVPDIALRHYWVDVTAAAVQRLHGKETLLHIEL